jgi:uncharacterized protein (DUF885 family)
MNRASASEIADELLHDLTPVDPTAADALGLEPENVMPALAPADFATRREAYLRAHRSLDMQGTSMPAELVLGTALRERVDAQLALDEAGFTTAQLASLATPMHQVREVFDNLPHETPPDWERVAEHLARVPSTVAAYSETLRAAANGGHVAAARQVLIVAAQCERWIGPDDFYRRLIASCDPRQRARLDAGAVAASESTAGFIEFLRGELLPRAPKTDRLGMLYGQRWRWARIVIDMGLHLGLPIPAGNGFTDATDWTPPVGVAMLRKAAGVDETTARFEVDRYLGWPAQALAFRVGAQLWRQARDAAERRPGFDLRAFHMRALRLGPLGLGPLREVMS